MKTILFYWSKGAQTRRKLIREISNCEKAGKPCYLNVLSEALGASHVAVKKHLDLLVEEGYVQVINPGGKPHYLKLTGEGSKVVEEFS